MILFSLLYAVPVAEWYLATSGSWAAGILEPHDEWLYHFISIHWTIQLAFTIAVHWSTSDALGRKKSRRPRWIIISSLVVGLVVAAMVPMLPTVAGLSPGEVIYRCFIGFYGLVFPAYVYLCMIPGRGRFAPSKRQWIVLTFSVLIASPMFWMGFIERKMLWLLPGLSVVLLARLFIPKTKTTFPESITATGTAGGLASVWIAKMQKMLNRASTELVEVSESAVLAVCDVTHLLIRNLSADNP